jgi:hypothetical protein
MGRRLNLVELVLIAGITLLTLYALSPSRADAPAVVASWTRTPGVADPQVTQPNIATTICTDGWSRGVRPPVSYTSPLKVKQMTEYGLAGSPDGYQEDHLISLELGGHPTDPRNLWPEPIDRARVVDGIENDLHHQVCSGDLTLSEAQQQESELKHRDG